MKRTSKILFLFIAIFSILFLAGTNNVFAFAADVYTCPTCNKKYNNLDEYNACVGMHNAEDKESEPETVYDCATCGKKFDNIDDYNACVDSHFNNINFHYDKYIDATVIELINSIIDIFNNIGIKDLITNVFEKVYTLIMGVVESAA